MTAIPIGVPFQRVDNIHLTTDDYYSSLTDAETFAAGPTGLPGCALSVLGANGVIGFYVIQPDKSLLRIGESGAAVTQTNIQVLGAPHGSWTEGATIPAGTTLDGFIQKLMQTRVAPTYKSPTLTISSVTPLTAEVGTTASVSVTPAYTQNQAGATTSYTLFRNGAQESTAASPGVVSGISLTYSDTATTFNATVAHAAGPVLYDNLGDPAPVGQIAAGNAASNTLTFSGKRGFFCGGTADVAPPANSADIRSLPEVILGPANNGSYTFTCPTGTKRVCFAYPATLKSVTKVSYEDLGGADYTAKFTETTVNVAGANGFTSVGYKVYTWLLAIPTNGVMTYTVTI